MSINNNIPSFILRSYVKYVKLSILYCVKNTSYQKKVLALQLVQQGELHHVRRKL